MTMTMFIIKCLAAAVLGWACMKARFAHNDSDDAGEIRWLLIAVGALVVLAGE